MKICVEYTTFNSVRLIGDLVEGIRTIVIYGYDDQRKISIYQKKVNNVYLDQYKKYHAGSHEKILYYDANENVDREVDITYVNSANGVFLAIINTNTIATGNDDEEYYYILTDHLGSVTMLVDETGTMYPDAEFSYDAWGRIRDAEDWSDYSLSQNQMDKFTILSRGFTGHEHYPEYDIINMNGRIYDPVIGQFMQPDNYVQFPELPGGYNRFSYCMNNPLNYTDPSGEVIEFMIMAASAVLLAENVHTTDMLYGSRAATSAAVQGLFEIGLNYALGELSSALFSEVGLTISDIGGSGVDFKLTPRLVYSSVDGVGLGIEAGFGMHCDVGKYIHKALSGYGLTLSVGALANVYGNGMMELRYGYKLDISNGSFLEPDGFHLGVSMQKYEDTRPGSIVQGTWMGDVGWRTKNDKNGEINDYALRVENDMQLWDDIEERPQDYFRTCAGALYFGNENNNCRLMLEIYTSDYLRDENGNRIVSDSKTSKIGDYTHVDPSLSRGRLSFGITYKGQYMIVAVENEAIRHFFQNGMHTIVGAPHWPIVDGRRTRVYFYNEKRTTYFGLY